MMKKVFLLIGLLGLVVSCSLNDDDTNVNYEFVPVVEYELPDTLVFGQRYQFPVRFISPSSCYQFYGFDYDRKDSTRFVYVVNKVFEDETCTQTPTDTLEALLNFEVVYQYNYIFKFFNGFHENDDATYLTDTIPVKL